MTDRPIKDLIERTYRDWAQAAEENPVLKARVKMLEEALDEIIRPVWYIQERAKASGDQIDGVMANKLARDPDYLRRIARAALKDFTP